MWPQWEPYVGEVHKSMLTVIQVITFDSWATDIVRPMKAVVPFHVCHTPGGSHTLYALWLTADAFSSVAGVALAGETKREMGRTST